MNQAMNTIDYTWSQTINSGVDTGGGVKGRQSVPLTAKNLPKIWKRGENQEKEGKIGKVLSLFPLLTDRAGYAMTINQ